MMKRLPRLLVTLCLCGTGLTIGFSGLALASAAAVEALGAPPRLVLAVSPQTGLAPLLVVVAVRADASLRGELCIIVEGSQGWESCIPTDERPDEDTPFWRVFKLEEPGTYEVSAFVGAVSTAKVRVEVR